MHERTIEAAFTKMVKDRGGLALKFVSPGNAGVPDRLVILPGGKVAFVELKAPGRRLQPLQKRRCTQLQHLGCQVHVVSGLEQIPEVIQKIEKGI